MKSGSNSKERVGLFAVFVAEDIFPQVFFSTALGSRDTRAVQYGESHVGSYDWVLFKILRFPAISLAESFNPSQLEKYAPHGLFTRSVDFSVLTREQDVKNKKNVSIHDLLGQNGPIILSEILSRCKNNIMIIAAHDTIKSRVAIFIT